MKILYIPHQFGPHFLGGADIYTYGIAAKMREAGHEVSVACVEQIADASVPPNTVKVINQPYNGLPVRRLSFDWRRMSDPYGALTLINPVVEKDLYEHLQELRPDVVHVTEVEWISAAAITAPKRLGLPVVVTLCGRWLLCPSATLLKRGQSLCEGRKDGLTCAECMFGQTWTYRALIQLPPGLRDQLITAVAHRPSLFKSSGTLNLIQAVQRRNTVIAEILSQVDHIIAPSHCFRRLYSQSGIVPVDRLVYSPYGHDVERSASGEFKTPSNKLRFGYIGNVVEAKGVDTVVAAFKLLGERTDVVLNIFGKMDTSMGFYQHLRQLAGDDDRVSFRGRYESDEITKVLAEIDVIIVPSKWIENSPLTVAEAHAAKTPVIGSDVCGVAEWIRHDVDGLLFKRGNAVDLAQQMQRFLDDPDLLPRLRSAIPPVKTVEQEVTELTSLYRSLIGETS